jgi:trypsin
MEVREDGSLPHPEYDSFSNDNNFMLLFLKSVPADDNNVKLVTLNSNPMVPAKGQEVTVMGWGDKSIRDDWTESSDVLQIVAVTVISNEKCDASEGTIGGWFETYEGLITDNKLCAWARRQDACQGDSGGPLVMKGTDGECDVQVGVIYWGFGCANRNYPGVYARVSRAHDWIEAEVCGRSVFAAEAGFDCGSHRSSSNNGNDESHTETFASAGGAYSRSSNNGNTGSHADMFASGYGNCDLHGEGSIAEDVLDFISSLLGGGNRS